MNQNPQVWIFCGVSGSGKTTIGRLFSQVLECDFFEGDRRHSPENIKKMSGGTPLSAQNRCRWFADIENALRWSVDQRQEVVMTCSALKIEYRQRLVHSGRVQLIYIDVPKLVLEQRLRTRQNHYMSLAMLDSQIAMLKPIQPEENVITIDGSGSIDDVMRELNSKVIERFPSLEKPWWER
jgi:gluconokinase